jgi:hypothetical protein
LLAPDLKGLNVDQEICRVLGKERGKLRPQKRMNHGDNLRKEDKG